jgi:hypothetical protein
VGSESEWSSIQAGISIVISTCQILIARISIISPKQHHTVSNCWYFSNQLQDLLTVFGLKILKIISFINRRIFQQFACIVSLISLCTFTQMKIADCNSLYSSRTFDPCIFYSILSCLWNYYNFALKISLDYQPRQRWDKNDHLENMPCSPHQEWWGEWPWIAVIHVSLSQYNTYHYALGDERVKSFKHSSVPF